MNRRRQQMKPLLRRTTQAPCRPSPPPTTTKQKESKAAITLAVTPPPPARAAAWKRAILGRPPTATASPCGTPATILVRTSLPLRAPKGPSARPARRTGQPAAGQHPPACQRGAGGQGRPLGCTSGAAPGRQPGVSGRPTAGASPEVGVGRMPSGGHRCTGERAHGVWVVCVWMCGGGWIGGGRGACPGRGAAVSGQGWRLPGGDSCRGCLPCMLQRHAAAPSSPPPSEQLPTDAAPSPASCHPPHPHPLPPAA